MNEWLGKWHFYWWDTIVNVAVPYTCPGSIGWYLSGSERQVKGDCIGGQCSQDDASIMDGMMMIGCLPGYNICFCVAWLNMQVGPILLQWMKMSFQMQHSSLSFTPSLEVYLIVHGMGKWDLYKVCMWITYAHPPFFLDNSHNWVKARSYVLMPCYPRQPTRMKCYAV